MSVPRIQFLGVCQGNALEGWAEQAVSAALKLVQVSPHMTTKITYLWGVCFLLY